MHVVATPIIIAACKLRVAAPVADAPQQPRTEFLAGVRHCNHFLGLRCAAAGTRAARWRENGVLHFFLFCHVAHRDKFLAPHSQMIKLKASMRNIEFTAQRSTFPSHRFKPFFNQLHSSAVDGSSTSVRPSFPHRVHSEAFNTTMDVEARKTAKTRSKRA